MTPEVLGAAAVAVKSTTGAYTAVGAIGTFVTVVIGLIGVWIKFGARWRELGIGERRGDLDDMRKRITDLEVKVETASAAAHAAEMKLVYAVAAVQLLASKIRATDQNDPALKQAMELLALATGGKLPGIGDKLSRELNDIKGTGE